MFGRFEVGGVEFTLASWASAGERATPLQLEALTRALAADPEARLRLRAWLVGEGIELAHTDELAALAAGLSTGRLAVLARRVPRLAYQEFGEVTEDEVEPVEPEPTEHDWIEIELVDEDDVPLPGVVFTLTMTDGSVRSGITNDRGRYFVPRTDPGQCKLKWTRLHPVERAPKFVAALAAAASAGA